MLNATQVNQYYGASHILWNTELDVPSGSCTCLMGRNGVGKTTLLNVIMGLLPIHSGTITFDNHVITSVPAHQRAQIGIGYVPQGRDIFPLLSVEENLHIGLSALGQQNAPIPERIFELFPVLKKMLRRRGGDLSGGQQQQLAIGRALAIQPQLLILDEPTEGIQPNIVQEIGDIIAHLNQNEKLTVLLVEQKLPFARKVAQRFCIMEKGESVASGPMDELSDELVQQHLAV